MRFIPIGIADSKFMDSFIRPSDFSNEHYDGIQLRRTVKDEPVLIMRSKETTPMDWKVVYGFCTIFFRTFEEAANFCTQRNMRLVKGEAGYDRD